MRTWLPAISKSDTSRIFSPVFLETSSSGTYFKKPTRPGLASLARLKNGGLLVPAVFGGAADVLELALDQHLQQRIANFRLPGVVGQGVHKAFLGLFQIALSHQLQPPAVQLFFAFGRPKGRVAHQFADLGGLGLVRLDKRGVQNLTGQIVFFLEQVQLGHVDKIIAGAGLKLQRHGLGPGRILQAARHGAGHGQLGPGAVIPGPEGADQFLGADQLGKVSGREKMPGKPSQGRFQLALQAHVIAQNLLGQAPVPAFGREQCLLQLFTQIDDRCFWRGLKRSEPRAIVMRHGGAVLIRHEVLPRLHSAN